MVYIHKLQFLLFIVKLNFAMRIKKKPNRKIVSLSPRLLRPKILSLLIKKIEPPKTTTLHTEGSPNTTPRGGSRLRPIKEDLPRGHP